MRRIWIIVLLLFQISQPAAYGLDNNVYDISPDSWWGFWKKSRGEQERLLVNELEARLSVKIRSAAKRRLAWNGAIAMTAVATVALAYHWDLYGMAMTSWLEWRGNAIALANRHIRTNVNEVYQKIKDVNQHQGTTAFSDKDQIDDHSIREFFRAGLHPKRILTAKKGPGCIEFAQGDGENAKTLLIPADYWPGIVKRLQEQDPDFPGQWQVPDDLADRYQIPWYSKIGGGAYLGTVGFVVSTGLGVVGTLAAFPFTILGGAAAGTAAVMGVRHANADRLERTQGERPAPLLVDADKIADTLRAYGLEGSLKEAAQLALTAVVTAGALWKWQEVLGVGALVVQTGIMFYDRVAIQVLPHVYAAGDYVAKYPGVMRDDFTLAFYHVTFSELIDDERAYIKLRHFMYPPLVERVDQVLTDAHDGKIGTDQASQFVRYAMRMPLTERYERYDRDDLKNRFTGFFSYYGENTKEVFKCILEDALTENLLVEESQRIGVARSSTLNRHTFLHGPQGVGKTYGVSGFAEIIDRPLSKMQLHASDHLQNEGIAFGLDGASPGRIAMGLMRATSDSSYHTLWSVALYDEADTSLNNPELVEFWKGALDPNSAGIYLPYFGVTFPWPHNVFFLGNTEIQDPALLSRLDVAQLDPYTQAQKRAILTDRLVPRLLRNDFNTVDFQAGTTRGEADQEEGLLSRMLTTGIGPSCDSLNEESYLFRNLPAELQRELLDLLVKHEDDPGMRGIEAGAKRVLGRHLLYHIY